MKKCTRCGAELAPEETVCPACGQEVTEETAAEEKAEAAQTEAETAACAQDAASENNQDEPAEENAEAGQENGQTQENAENAEEQPEGAPAELTQEAAAPKKVSPWLWVAGVLAVCAIVAAILLVGKKNAQQAQLPAESGTTQTQDAEEDSAAAQDGFVSYTATQEQLTDEKLALPVAVCGDQTMTNRSLAFYYWQQYYTFANNYGMYLSYLIDDTKGLDEQQYSEDQTWQQAFLGGAADMFHSITALNLEADKAGFELDAEDQAQLDAIPASLDATASYYGMDSGLAYLQASFGPTATVEDYVAFARDNLRASRYMELLMEQMELTDEEISDYYDQNADAYAESRVEKIDKPMVDVRHILVIPAEQDENGEYTEAAWQEAEQKAEAILNEWKSGEATEESFAALAEEDSEDPGSSSNGGLYEDVYPGQMVDEFDAWCFDDARQPGDTGIVKTDYGYHIMYFAGKGEEIFWVETARGDLLSERAAQLDDSLREQYPMELTLENAAIFDVQAEERAAANAAAEAEVAQSEDTQTEEDASAQTESGTDASQQEAAQ